MTKGNICCGIIIFLNICILGYLGSQYFLNNSFEKIDTLETISLGTGETLGVITGNNPYFFEAKNYKKIIGTDFTAEIFNTKNLSDNELPEGYFYEKDFLDNMANKKFDIYISSEFIPVGVNSKIGSTKSEFHNQVILTDNQKAPFAIAGTCSPTSDISPELSQYCIWGTTKNGYVFHISGDINFYNPVFKINYKNDIYSISDEKNNVLSENYLGKNGKEYKKELFQSLIKNNSDFEKFTTKLQKVAKSLSSI